MHAHEACSAEILIMMTKGHMEDVFAPYVWATPHAKEFWAVGMAQNMTSHAQEMEGFVISNIRGGHTTGIKIYYAQVILEFLGMAKVANDTMKHHDLGWSL